MPGRPTVGNLRHGEVACGGPPPDGAAAPKRSIRLKIHDAPVLVSHGNGRASLPGKPQLYKESGQQRDANGGPANTLVHSIVDRVVCSPERLVFHGPPVLDPPLAQDKPVSLAVAVANDALEALVACPSLRILELAIIREQQGKLRHQLKALRDQTRSLFVTQQIELATRIGMALDRARQIVERHYAGILLLALAPPAGNRLLGTRGVTP
jgi:hypothetical protein